MSEDRSERWRPEISIRSPEWDHGQTDLVLDYFKSVNKGAQINFGKDIGELDEAVVVATIKRGIQTGKIRWIWGDWEDMLSDVAVLSIPESRNYVQVVTSDAWLEKVSPSIPEIVVRRYKLFGKEIGRKIIKYNDDRRKEKRKKDDTKVRNLINDIYVTYRSLPD